MFNDKWNKRFLRLAREISTWSKDSTQVAAVIVRPDKTIAGAGFNGFPAWMKDKSKWYKNRKEKYSRIIHSEKNASNYTYEKVEGYTLYTYPMPPCDKCCVEFLGKKIKNFVWFKPSKELKKRWNRSFKKTKKYIKEVHGKYIEYPKI